MNRRIRIALRFLVVLASLFLFTDSAFPKTLDKNIQVFERELEEEDVDFEEVSTEDIECKIDGSSGGDKDVSVLSPISIQELNLFCTHSTNRNQLRETSIHLKRLGLFILYCNLRICS